jgi:Collagen triple helix repeat (20 copies)
MEEKIAMFSAMLRRRVRVSPASVVAVLALVFAMSGGAYAAKKYLITSTKQIKPSVLKQLKGLNGKDGAAGVAGPSGPQGAAGSQGPQGVQGTAGPKGEPGPRGEKGETGEKGTTGFTQTLPAGDTETGAWTTVIGATVSGINAGVGLRAASFAIPLSQAVATGSVTVHPEGYDGTDGVGPEHEECPGKAEEPKAAPGKLCFYTESDNGIEPTVDVVRSSTVAGVVMMMLSEHNGQFALGTWAVTGE